MATRSQCVLLLCVLTLSSGCAESVLRPGEGFVDVPGGPVWYRIVGSGDATPVLFVHGGPGASSCAFHELAVALSAERPVVLYDQLGCGRSGRPTDPSLWQVDRFVRELAAVRHALHLRRVHLVGHSWGTALATEYMVKAKPDGIASLVLAGPFLSTAHWIADANQLRAQLPEPVQQTLTRHEQAGTTDSKEYKAATEVFYDRFLFHRQPRPKMPACEGWEVNDAIYKQMWGPSEFYATGSLLSFDVTPHLTELRLPVLFIVGRYDEARPETVAGYHALVRGAKLEILEQSGHMAPVEEPERYLEILREFFRSVDGRIPESACVLSSMTTRASASHAGNTPKGGRWISFYRDMRRAHS